MRLFGEGKSSTYPEPPVLGGEPVAPSVMTRAVVEKQRRGRATAAWRKDVRSMVARIGWCAVGG